MASFLLAGWGKVVMLREDGNRFTSMPLVQWLGTPDQWTLRSQEVQIWLAHLVESDSQLQRFWSFLAPDEQERANRFRFAEHQKRFIACRGILRSLLGRYLDQDPVQLRFDYGPQGKPVLSPHTGWVNLQFNLSHSQDYAVYAIAQQSVGIDLEYIRPLTDLEHLTDRFFSAREHQAIQALPIEQQAIAFFRHWTCKEALLKASGQGLGNLQAVEISLDEHQVQVLRLDHQPEPLNNWTVSLFYPVSGFVAAIASATAAVRYSFQRWPDTW